MEAAESHPDWTGEIAALRRVARALVGDEHAADDVLQDAWLRAQRHAAAPGRSAAYWKRVVANLARDRRRGEARRAEREAHAARPEALPSSADVVARLELVQRVVRAATELDEPYRSTIHDHYFEDLSAPEIAERYGLPLETVRTRIRRGLERMRAALDQSTGGDRAAWCLALAPIALRRASEPALGAGAALITVTGGIVAMGKLLIVAAGVSAAVAALWFTSRGAPTTRPIAPPGPSSVVSDVARDASAPRPDPTRVPQVETDPRAALAVETAPSAIADGPIELAGTFVLSTASGASRSDVDGYFLLERTAADGRSEEELVLVEGGRWTAHAVLGEHLKFHQAYADGHPARLGSEPVPVPQDGRVALEAVAWPRTRLRVVDAATGHDLNQVELRWGTMNYMPTALRHPGDPGEWDVRRTGLSSPFDVDLPGALLGDSSLRLWVSAPGLAWDHVDVLPAAGGTRTIELSPSGDLEVYPCGPRPESPWLIRLVERVGDPVTTEQAVAWQLAAQGEVTRLDRLAPGTYSVGAIPDLDRPGISSSSEFVQVRAGEVTRVSLPLERAALGPRVHLSGTLTWPEGTPLGDLVIEPLSPSSSQAMVSIRASDMTPDAKRPRTLRWEVGEVLAGEYLAIQARAGLRQRFDTGTGSEFRLDLALPPRVPVLVRVLDADSGSPVPGATLTWTLPRTDDGGFAVWTEKSDPAEPGIVRFDAPAVGLVVEVAAPGWTPQEFDLAPGPGAARELEVRLRRESGLRVRVLEGDAVVPGFWARPRIIDPSGEPVRPIGWTWSATECRILLDPGTYRLAFEELEPRWRSPGWIEVRIVAGALTPVDVPLERAP